jgi:teichuronic acid biosynthesis glycosyltransferase TuaH
VRIAQPAAVGAAPTQSWDGLVVIASGTSWDDTWLSEKHLALHLAKHVPVLFVDPPASVLTPLRKPALRGSTRGPRLRVLDRNLARLTPLTVPGISRPGLRTIGEWFTRRAIARAVARLGGTVDGLVVASLDDVFGACDARVTVLYGTDDWVAGAELMGIPSGWLRRRERARLATADVVVTVSPGLADRWARTARTVLIIPNGCDTGHFSAVDEAAPSAAVTLPDPIAGFIGHLSDRIDIGLLESVAASGASLLLVGPRQLTFDLERMTALLAHPNVQWVGARSFDELPALMRRITVGLTPYTDSDFNQSSDPLKTLEYLAAGRPAVVTDLPSAHRIPAGLVEVCATPADFTAQTLRLLRQPADAEQAERRRSYALTQSWAARSLDFLAIFTDARSGRQIVPDAVDRGSPGPTRSAAGPEPS